MAGASLFLYTASYSHNKGKQGLLQQILRQRTAVLSCERQVWPFPEKGYSRMDEVKIFQIWIFNFLLYYVFPNALEYLAGLCRDKEPEYGRDIALDI